MGFTPCVRGTYSGVGFISVISNFVNRSGNKYAMGSFLGESAALTRPEAPFVSPIALLPTPARMEYLRLIEQYADAKTDISRLQELEGFLLTAVPAVAIAGEAIAEAGSVLSNTAPVSCVNAEKYSHADSASETQADAPTPSVDCEALEALVREGEGKLKNYQKTGKQLEERLARAQEGLAQTQAKLEVQRRLCADAYGHAKDLMLASFSRSQ